jgi:hypothetical protein
MRGLLICPLSFWKAEAFRYIIALRYCPALVHLRVLVPEVGVRPVGHDDKVFRVVFMAGLSGGTNLDVPYFQGREKTGGQQADDDFHDFNPWG